MGQQLGALKSFPMTKVRFDAPMRNAGTAAGKDIIESYVSRSRSPEIDFTMGCFCAIIGQI